MSLSRRWSRRGRNSRQVSPSDRSRESCRSPPATLAASRCQRSGSAAIPAGAVETARLGYGNQAVANPPSQGFDGGQRTVFKRADWRRYSLIDGRPLDIFATIQTLAATEEV